MPNLPATWLLIVEDNPDSRSFLRQLLEQVGFSVKEAVNGQEAVNMHESWQPDLIWMDIRMPEMDGYEVCERLKSDKNYRHIPVIFLSALQKTDEKVKFFEAGAVDFITKPFQAEEVLARVEALTTLYRLRKKLEELVAERTAEEMQHKHIIETTGNPSAWSTRSISINM
jgi:CheY-like chemotaxis protein